LPVVETATPETAATEEPKVDAEPAEDNVKEDAATYDAPPENGWYQEYPGGPWYWYENGVRQGTTGRGKEIYDPKSDAWYWLDAVQGGATLLIQANACGGIKCAGNAVYRTHPLYHSTGHEIEVVSTLLVGIPAPTAASGSAMMPTAI